MPPICQLWARLPILKKQISAPVTTLPISFTKFVKIDSSWPFNVISVSVLAITFSIFDLIKLYHLSKACSHTGTGPSILISSFCKVTPPCGFFLKGRYNILKYPAPFVVSIIGIPWIQWCTISCICAPIIASIFNSSLSIFFKNAIISSFSLHSFWYVFLSQIFNFNFSTGSKGQFGPKWTNKITASTNSFLRK